MLSKATKAFARTVEIYDTTIGWRFINKELNALYGTDSILETAENVAERFNIARENQDIYAYNSQQKTAKAIKNGRLEKEITPVTITSKKETITITTDEHPRANILLEKLASLPTPFREGGSVAAGNSSGVNDGAAASFLASEQAITKHNLTPCTGIVSFASAGVEPAIMGVGPVSAAKKALKKANLTFDDISVIELNEAFASQVLASQRRWGLDDSDERVNQNGGAITLGPPLGMSDTRLVINSNTSVTCS